MEVIIFLCLILVHLKSPKASMAHKVEKLWSFQDWLLIAWYRLLLQSLTQRQPWLLLLLLLLLLLHAGVWSLLMIDLACCTIIFYGYICGWCWKECFKFFWMFSFPLVLCVEFYVLQGNKLPESLQVKFWNFLVISHKTQCTSCNNNK